MTLNFSNRIADYVVGRRLMALAFALLLPGFAVAKPPAFDDPSWIEITAPGSVNYADQSAAFRMPGSSETDIDARIAVNVLKYQPEKPVIIGDKEYDFYAISYEMHHSRHNFYTPFAGFHGPTIGSADTTTANWHYNAPAWALYVHVDSKGAAIYQDGPRSTEGETTVSEEFNITAAKDPSASYSHGTSYSVKDIEITRKKLDNRVTAWTWDITNKDATAVKGGSFEADLIVQVPHGEPLKMVCNSQFAAHYMYYFGAGSDDWTLDKNKGLHTLGKAFSTEITVDLDGDRRRR